MPRIPIAQFIELKNYGYTIDEIREFEGTPSDPVQTGGGSADRAHGVQPPGEPIPEPAPDPTPEPAPDPTPEPAQENETQQLLREMLGIIRRNNINGLNSAVPGDVDPAEIVATILNPN